MVNKSVERLKTFQMCVYVHNNADLAGFPKLVERILDNRKEVTDSLGDAESVRSQLDDYRPV